MKIIFVCTGNTCRSPMAKFLLENMIKQNPKPNIEVLSAGISVYSSMPISDHVRTLLSEKNIDTSSHSSALFSPQLVDAQTLILTMGVSHKEAILSRYPVFSPQTYALFEYIGEGKDISDPFGESLEIYRSCLSELEYLINKLYLQI